ncbi:DUF7573 domain-containing protein [Haloplanus sp. C73]|uniref:DUF7573 domain-containing protein n=1 Tax=Haloplanus sp. C73 TaxID=3421641 RepID=UPI003EBCE10D
MSDPSLDDVAPGDDAAVPTARWTADGVCDACEAVVSWRFRDDERYVCADCKEW